MFKDIKIISINQLEKDIDLKEWGTQLRTRNSEKGKIPNLSKNQENTD